MGVLMKNGINYSTGGGGGTEVVDGLTSTSATAALSAKQGNVLGNSLGAIEVNNIATAQHIEGEYFIWVDQFVKATDAIAIGDTISSSNTDPTTVSESVDAIDKILGDVDISTIGDGTVTGAIRYINDLIYPTN